MAFEQGRCIRVVAAVVAQDGRYLITRRRATAVLPLLWEFPGGRVEEGESDENALIRELEERLGAIATVGRMISSVTHPYENYSVDLMLYECQLAPGDLSARAVAEYRWVTSEEFDELEFTPADEASMSKLLGVT